MVLIKIDNAIRILHDCAVSRTRREAPGIGTVHALVFTHQPAELAIRGGVLIEANQVPIVPSRIGHGLVRIVKGCRMEWIAVPFEACNLTGFAADARSRVHQLANVVVPRHVPAWNSSGVTRDCLDLEKFAGHLKSP